MFSQKKCIEPLLDWRLWAPPAAMVIFGVAIANYSFLAFHALTELFAIVISFVMFAFAWSTHGFYRNNFLLFLASGYFLIGSLDLMHILVYNKMDVFVEEGGNMSVSFSTGTRYSEALLLLAAPFAAIRKQYRYLSIVVFGIIAVGLTALILSGQLPIGFVEGKGHTEFRIYGERLIVPVLALALIALFSRRRDISTEEMSLISASIVMTICAELAFTFFIDIYEFSNLVGHIFKLFSIWLVFQVIVLSNLKKPYRELIKEKETSIRQLAKIQEQESNFEAIFNAIPDGIVVTDTDRIIVAANRGMEKTFGYTIDDLAGKRASILNESYEEYERQGRIRFNMSDEEKIEPFEVNYRRKDGQVFVGETVGTAIKGAKAETLGFIGVVRDITERKHLENRLHRSQRMEAVGQLTGGIAHDFNNLMSVVFGNAELLKDMIGDDEKARRRLESIVKAVDLGASLTNRLLAFSRQQTLSPQPTDINDLVRGLEDMLQRALGETIEFHTHLESGGCESLIDSSQLENALINLAVNARDAMPKGGVLTIETANVTLDGTYAKQNEEVTPGDYVMIAVSDTGGGMAPEVLEKVFEPFFTTKGVGRGSGLGLSMVYGFVMQSKGHVTIYSEVGHGTTIKLYMPRSRESVNQDDTRDETTEFTPGSERILVVEDNEGVREIPAGILRNQGYQVVEAEDGEEAIRHLQDGPPFDLLFTDIALPGGMNGVQIAEQAKRIQPDIKVLFTTGYAENAVARNGKLDPGITLVNKPYRRTELLEKVRAMLDSTDLSTL